MVNSTTPTTERNRHVTYDNDPRGNWMETVSGQRFYPLDPREDEIHIEDISHALAHICRFGGHVRRFYTVAEHCVLMADAALDAGFGEDTVKHMLLHDATEAYVGDMVRPLKRAIPHYEAIEDNLWDVIVTRFDLAAPGLTKPVVKEYDNRILLDERNAVCNPSNNLWGPEFASLTPLGVAIQAWEPAQAEFEYSKRLYELGVK